MDTKARNPGYDYLKAVACIGIIYLHTIFSTTLMYADRITARQTLFSEIFMNNLMWAVPCFIMVTGALLLAMSRVTKKHDPTGKNEIALLWAGGHPPKEDADTLAQIRALRPAQPLCFFVSNSLHLKEDERAGGSACPPNK